MASIMRACVWNWRHRRLAVRRIVVGGEIVEQCIAVGRKLAGCAGVCCRRPGDVVALVIAAATAATAPPATPCALVAFVALTFGT